MRYQARMSPLRVDTREDRVERPAVALLRVEPYEHAINRDCYGVLQSASKPVSPTNPWRHPPGVPRCVKPRAEGRFHLPGGRGIGYAEYGDPNGPVVLWFHGTPGGRRQLPLVGRRAAEKLGQSPSPAASPRWPC